MISDFDVNVEVVTDLLVENVSRKLDWNFRCINQPIIYGVKCCACNIMDDINLVSY